MRATALLLGSVLVLSLLANAHSADAQQGRLQITSVATEGWPTVEVSATIVDQAGRPIQGLEADALQVTVDGEARPFDALTTTSDPAIPIALALVFDVSGSMEGQPIQQAREAGKALVSQLGASDQVALLAFSNEGRVVQPFTSDKGVVLGAIDGLQAGGDTGLYSAVELAAQTVAQTPLPRRAVVLLSDGLDFGVTSPATRDSSLGAAAASGAMFMAIGLGETIDSEYLGALSAPGGGQFLVAPAPQDLGASYQAAADVLRQQYVLRFDGSGLERGGTLGLAASTGTETLTGEAALVPPAGVVPVPVQTDQPAAPPPVVKSEPAAETSSGSSSPVLPIALVGALAVAIAGFALLFLRRRHVATAAAANDFSEHRFTRPAQEGDYPVVARAVADDDSGAWLELKNGKRHSLGTEPQTVGYGSDCSLDLKNGAGERIERVRIWRRDGRYMLHNVSRLGSIAVDGRPVTWVILENGDQITIGAETLTFHDSETESSVEEI